MEDDRRFIPSITALRTLEAAARCGSFSRAAEELGVTQTAVSHQMRQLEAQLGLELFHRAGSGITPTEAAHRYMPAVRAALGILADATEAVVSSNQDDVLTIGTFATLGIKWLMPMLPAFRAANPSISLRLSAREVFDSENVGLTDIEIRWGDGQWPGTSSDLLFPDVLLPVAAPAWLAENEPIRQPADFTRHPIIWSGPGFRRREDWPAWLRGVGCAGLDLPVSITFEYALPAQEAAAQGLGIALGRQGFIDHDVALGRLSPALDLPVPTGKGYFLITPPQEQAPSKTRRFREWILDVTASQRSGRPSFSQ